MAIHDSHSVAMGRDLNGGQHFESRRSRVDRAKDFSSFPLDLLFLAANIWDDVIEDVHRWNTGIPATGNGLEGCHGHKIDSTEGISQSLQRHNETSGRAIGIGNQKSFFEVALGPLIGDHREVRGVNQRDNERGDGVPAVVLGIGKDDKLVLNKLGFYGSES
jgi:hypothetical protein